MNQQRARRFKSAREAEEAADAALRRGEPPPAEGTRFDSNCITPGTRERRRARGGSVRRRGKGGGGGGNLACPLGRW